MKTRLRPVTISDAALRLGLPRTTVASWANRGWTDRNGNRQHLEPVDYEGPKHAPRYRLVDIQQAEFEIGLNNRRSHRRGERWRKIQADRIEQFGHLRSELAPA